MRITYVCADTGVSLSKHNGSAAHLRAVVTAFVELGHDVEVLLADPSGSDVLPVAVHEIPRPRFAESLSALVRRAGSDAPADAAGTTALLRALRRLWDNVALEQALAAHLSRRRPDLVYERLSPFAVAGAATARRLGCPHVLEVNAPLAWEGAKHRGQALPEAAQLLEWAALAATSRIVAVSAELRDHLIADGADARKITVVPNGADVDAFAPEGPALPPALDAGFVVGFVGSLKAWHGIDVLASAFRLLAVDPDMHLLVVGDGPMAGELERLESALPGRVTRIGMAPPGDVPAYLRRMHVAVAPYPQLDCFYFSPLKVLEYMASGRAIVASRIGQLQHLIRDGETGLLVEPGNAAELAAAVRRLRDSELRVRVARSARLEVERRHTWRMRAAAILDGQPAGMSEAVS
ncbi:MAG TPA: glycosyltransferase family 4 protein [Planctomycetota bacterium]|nr:glycosyltransferase family 4 protein [Planctomycetota bacterium]